MCGSYIIEKHSFICIKFKNSHPQLKESTVRDIHQKYEEELRQALTEKREPKSSLSPGQRGRPLMLGKIDLMVQDYLRVCLHLQTNPY